MMKPLPLLLALAVPVHAAERDISIPWCIAHNGAAEVILADGKRADCLTDTTAYEVGYPGKWEDLGQAIHYARMTGKRPGVAIILQKDADLPLVQRLRDDLWYAGDRWVEIVVIDLR